MRHLDCRRVWGLDNHTCRKGLAGVLVRNANPIWVASAFDHCKPWSALRESMQQMPSITLDSRGTQRSRILKLLIEARGNWVPLMDLLALGIAQYNARV